MMGTKQPHINVIIQEATDMKNAVFIRGWCAILVTSVKKKGNVMNKTCFCGISEHCGYQIETDMEQHDKVIYEQGYNNWLEWIN